MNSLDVVGIVDAIHKRLFARVNFSDADYASVVENKLEQEALEALSEGLRQVSDAESVAWLIKRVAQLEARVNALSQIVYQMEKAAGPLSSLPPEFLTTEKGRSVVLMDENVVQNGFYDTEHTDMGVSFRWLGPASVARVYLTKIRLPLELTFVLIAVHRAVALEAVRIAFNDGPWVSIKVDHLDGSIVLRCRPDSGPSGDGLVHHIDIDCGATFSPIDEGGADPRSLGIALSRIELVSIE